MSVSRAEFLGRIRTGLDRSSTSAPVPPASVPQVDDALIRLTRADENLPDLFAKRAAATGMVVHHSTASSIVATVESILTSIAARRIVIDDLGSPISQSIATTIGGTIAVIAPHAARSLDPQFDADAGITGVFAAIAETGTLVVASDALRSRGSFLIPPTHIAIVHASQLIADMTDLWPRLAHELPTALTLITGPSKTADIEGILVTGVHGPQAVHIVLIHDSFDMI